MSNTCRMLVVFVLSMLPCLTVWGADEATEGFVTCAGDQLQLDGKKFRFVSFNIPNLHLIEDNFSFTRPNPWRWPNAYEIEDALESVRQMGGTVVRVYVLSVRREGSDMGDHVFVKGPGEFNEEAFRTLDLVLAIAREKGVRVIIPFVDNWHWWGGRAEYAKFRDKQPDDFWTDEQVIADFEATIQYTLTRKNSVNGLLYRDDPTIFGWETGNELDSPPEWTRRIAAFIKSVDSNHLVIDGYSLHGVRQASLDDPNIDVITTHHYPNTDQDYVSAILTARQKTAGKKPYFVGEFGFVPVEEMERVLNTVIEHDVSGALLWSLRFHRREGGFYWHWEPASEGAYKAYHWPGFASGAAYNERQVLSLMREKAYAIRQQAVPPRTVPKPPKLLAINDVSAISWQGSAGAESYDVQRATSPTGPWKAIGENVSDARVQYRHLFNDATAEVGNKFFYRVCANNVAGASRPSNVVGPVLPRWKTLVDECDSLNGFDSYQGDLSLVEDNERNVQEDCHRVKLAPGSSATYRVDRPICQFRIYAFFEATSAEDDPSNLQVETSADGRRFDACPLQRETVPIGKGDYSYLTPELLTGTATADSRFLRIALPEEPSSSKPSSSKQVADVELSRVEIRYDCQ